MANEPVATLDIHRQLPVVAEHQSITWTIFCLFVSEKVPFSIKIQPDATVDELKEAIKEKTRVGFDESDARSLTLFKVDIPDDDDLEENANQLLTTEPKALRATVKLSKLYEAAPPEEMVHILVQHPNNGK